MASKGVGVITEVLEFRCIEAPDHVVQQLDLNPGDSVVKLTRLRYAKDSFEKGPIVLTTSYIISDIWPWMQRCDMEHTALRDVLKKHHIDRCVMEKEITVYNLNEREARLLGEAPNTPVIAVCSTSWDPNGRKVECSESIYPANRNRFLLRIRK